MNDALPHPAGLPAAAAPLLGPDDPPPFERLNPDGRASLILVCDHAGNAIPKRLRRLGLGSRELNQHIAWDIGAAEVTRRLARRLDAPALLANYSRLVIDCNRPPGDPASIARVSDGVFVPGNQRLSDSEADARLEALFWPYHHAITNTLAHLWRHGRAPALIAIHSFTPMLKDGHPRPWHVGILWNRDPRLALPTLQHLRAYPDLCVGDNEPYSGRELGYTMQTHAGAAGLAHMEFEIRHDLLLDPAGWDRWAGIIGDVLTVVLVEESIYTVEHF